MRARCFKSTTVPLSIAAIDKMYCLQFFNQNSERLWLNFHAKGFAAIAALSLLHLQSCVYGSRWSLHSSPPTCRPWRRLSVTSCGAEAPTLWHPWPRRVTWSSFASSWLWPPAHCTDAPVPWQKTYGMSLNKTRGGWAGRADAACFFLWWCFCVCTACLVQMKFRQN